MAMLLGVGARFVTVLRPEVRSLIGLVLVVAGAVLLGVPWWSRVTTALDEEARRNPTGSPRPWQDRLDAVRYPRAWWAGAAASALGFALATAWAIAGAVRTHESSYVGLALLLCLPVSPLAWLGWSTRSLLRRR